MKNSANSKNSCLYFDPINFKTKKMGAKKQTEARYMEIEVPEQVMAEVAEIISESSIEANILGTGDEPETITVGFDYPLEERENMMNILEIVEDCYDNGEEEEEESEED